MLHIGRLSFESPLVLAPLAGYTDLPFRLLCRAYGAGYCVSEMISCHGLTYGQKNTLKMVNSIEQEKPVSFQLFGADADIMADAAEILASFHPDMIDINMGCPVKKVTKGGAGAALMTTPKLAERILKKICLRVSLPVTVKIRSGKDSNHITGVEFAQMAENCGVSAIAVHGRTWSQGFSGRSDKKIISDIKEAVTIPVLGNGDIHSYKDAHKLMAETGCDGVMIGRSALGNPWVFSKQGRPAGFAEILSGANKHLQLIEQCLPAEKMVGSIKSQMCNYFKAMPGSSTMRQEILTARNLNELKQKMDAFAPANSALKASTGG